MGAVMVMWLVMAATAQVPVVFIDGEGLSEGDSCTLKDGSSGVCSTLQDCDGSVDDIRQGVQPQVCSFSRHTSIICCSTANFLRDSLPKENVITTQEEGKTQKACSSYFQQLLTYKKSPDYPACPSIFYQYVIGGEAARAREFPHMAAIGYGEEKDVSWFCGGSLVSARYVLTAGHCLVSRNKGPARWVRLGDLNLVNSTDDAPAQQLAIAELIPHPDYKPPARYNDIALLRLDKDAVLNEFIRPACLHTQNTFQTIGQVTGWGLTDAHNTNGSAALMKVNLPVQTAEQCSTAFNSQVGTRRLREGFNDTTMLCVGILAGGKDTCQGDSGGPYQVSKRELAPCIYEIAGVTSFGKSVCGAKNSPAVYTRVLNFVPWIESIVWP